MIYDHVAGNSVQTFFAMLLLVCLVGKGNVLAATAECYDGTLWQALGAISGVEGSFGSDTFNVSIWKNSLDHTGLSQLLEEETPGAALLVVEDSGLLSCGLDEESSPRCLLEERWWYANLTGPRGVGLLMLHWLPGSDPLTVGFEPSGISDDIPLEAESLLATATNESWPLRITSNASSVNGDANKTALKVSLVNNGSPDNATVGEALVVRVVETCDNGVLYILDRPLVPKSLPVTSVNALPPLRDYCWRNIVQVIVDNVPESYTEEQTARALLLYEPTLFQFLLDPRVNITMLIQGKHAMVFFLDYIFFVTDNNPSGIWNPASAAALFNSVPGGRCPYQLYNTSLRPILSLLDEAVEQYRLNFTRCPKGMCATFIDINMPNDDLFTYDGLQTLGAACASMVYSYDDDIELAFRFVGGRELPSPSQLDDIGKLWSKRDLEGLVPSCSNGTSASSSPYASDQQLKEGDTIEENNFGNSYSTDEGGGLSLGAIAGIVVGVVVAVVSLGLLIWYRNRLRQRTQSVKKVGISFGCLGFPDKDAEAVAHMNGSEISSSSLTTSMSPKPSFQSSGTDKLSDVLLPSVPWHDFLLQPQDITWERDPASGERLLLGAGRFGRVYKAILRGSEVVAVKCVAMAYGNAGDINGRFIDPIEISGGGIESSNESDSCGGSRLEKLGTSESSINKEKNNSVTPSLPLQASKAHSANSSQKDENGLCLDLQTIRSQFPCIDTMPVQGAMREISLLKGFRSQHIVSFLGACIMENEVMLVTEFMPGGDLWSALRRGSINWWNGGLEIALDVSAALTYLHAMRVVHLDVKSSNILLKYSAGIGAPNLHNLLQNRTSRGSLHAGSEGIDSTALDLESGASITSSAAEEIDGVRSLIHPPGLAKLSDVGLAKVLPMSHEYIGLSNACGGTWPWVAPECILGQRCSSAADMYSFGVVLWEIVTGEIPVRGMLRDVEEGKECPEGFGALITSCWEANPAARPTAFDMMTKLQEMQRSRPRLS